MDRDAMTLRFWLNTAWMWRRRGELVAFHRATRSVAETQTAVLREILTQNRHSEFGITHGFSEVGSPAEFVRRVPLSKYDDYQGAIKKIAAGRINILTTEPVRLFEPTSGSTGGEKLIPYTPLLRAQFQRGIGAWITDLMLSRPAVRRGRAYWSISPLMRRRFTEGGIPICFDDDAAYLGMVERSALKKLLAVPSAVSRIVDVESFRYCTLAHLLLAEDLTLISIWSPTFLTTLLGQLKEWGESICRALSDGSPTPNSDQSIPTELWPRADKRR